MFCICTYCAYCKSNVCIHTPKMKSLVHTPIPRILKGFQIPSVRTVLNDDLSLDFPLTTSFTNCRECKHRLTYGECFTDENRQSVSAVCSVDSYVCTYFLHTCTRCMYEHAQVSIIGPCVRACTSS
jgi:hypothetical protein